MSSPIDRGAYRSKNEWTCAHCHKKFPATAPLYRVKYKHYRRKFGDFVCYECAVNYAIKRGKIAPAAKPAKQ